MAFHDQARPVVAVGSMRRGVPTGTAGQHAPRQTGRLPRSMRRGSMHARIDARADRRAANESVAISRQSARPAGLHNRLAEFFPLAFCLLLQRSELEPNATVARIGLMVVMPVGPDIFWDAFFECRAGRLVGVTVEVRTCYALRLNFGAHWILRQVVEGRVPPMNELYPIRDAGDRN
jgi:hypothetical protein